jgi:hypothetical protein
VHRLSPALTLQGAVAHCDMPVETGPTLYLPHSQKYPAGYLVADRADFRAYFAEHHVQLPLTQGRRRVLQPGPAARRRAQPLHRRPADGEPAAGLLGVRAGDGAGRPRPGGRRRAARAAPHARRGAAERQLHHVVAAAAEGYPFPADLDRTPPVDGLAPPTRADLLAEAVRDDWDDARFAAALAGWAAHRNGRRRAARAGSPQRAGGLREARPAATVARPADDAAWPVTGGPALRR